MINSQFSILNSQLPIANYQLVIKEAHCQLPITHYKLMVEYAKKELPIEACGLLGGIIEGNKKIVKKVYFLTNIDKSPVHFTMEPKEQFAAVRDMRKNGWILLGNFHSHPHSPAMMSEEDIRLAFDTDLSYLILSLANDEPILNSFSINRNDSNGNYRKITQEKLIIK